VRGGWGNSTPFQRSFFWWIGKQEFFLGDVNYPKATFLDVMGERSLIVFRGRKVGVCFLVF
jgi:hypothetical protein